MGRVLAWNDDHEDKESGLRTHHADSYLSASVETDGAHYVHLVDALSHGGDAFSYRLRISSPRPDFALRVTPSSINVPKGGVVPIHVYAVRKDGFDGEIELMLKDSPAGFALQGARIPAGRDHVRMTLSAPWAGLDRPVSIELHGHAVIGGEEVFRPAVPAEDMMQAFLYRHLAVSQDLMVCVTGKRPGPPISMVERDRVRVPVGGSARVKVQTPGGPNRGNVQLQLSEPPEGVTLEDVSVVPGGLAFKLKADQKALPIGYADNLIVEAYVDVTRRGKSGQQKRRTPAGVLPAIPFEIVQR
jgi:hypothetical protein